jgi:subtilisin family serine protease
MEEAIQNAQNQGVIVVAAAGNESSNNDQRASFPAGYPGVVSVASSDEGDRLSSFSNFGSTSVTLAAPGSNILSTYPGKTQRKLSGTSMATPQVSGALALAMSVNARLSRVALQERLCASSKQILLSQTKCGRLDVMSLLESVR